jgi:hypothetical protein
LPDLNEHRMSSAQRVRHLLRSDRRARSDSRTEAEQPVAGLRSERRFRYDRAMDDADLRAIADAWWGSEGDEDASVDLYDMLWERSPDVPRLIALMVRSPRALRIPYVGTAIVESLYHANVSTALDITLAAQLTADELFEVLSGVYPEILVHLRVPEKLAAVLTSAQIDWLTSYDAPNRHDSL